MPRRQPLDFDPYYRTCSECPTKFLVEIAHCAPTTCSKKCRRSRNLRIARTKLSKRAATFPLPGVTVSKTTLGLPRPLFREMSFREVEVHRRVWCKHYDKCLAVMEPFESFTCGLCPLHDEVPVKLRREEGEFLAKKLKLLREDSTV
jgi:hypothetical protein